MEYAFISYCKQGEPATERFAANIYAASKADLIIHAMKNGWYIENYISLTEEEHAAIVAADLSTVVNK